MSTPRGARGLQLRLPLGRGPVARRAPSAPSGRPRCSSSTASAGSVYHGAIDDSRDETAVTPALPSRRARRGPRRGASRRSPRRRPPGAASVAPVVRALRRGAPARAAATPPAVARRARRSRSSTTRGTARRGPRRSVRPLVCRTARPAADIASNYYPAPRRLLPSSDPTVIRSQDGRDQGRRRRRRSSSRGGGRHRPRTRRLPAVIAAAQSATGSRWPRHIEPYPDRSVASVVADIGYLRARSGSRRFYVFQALDFPERGLGAGERPAHRRAGVRARPRSSAPQRPGHFDGVYTATTCCTYGGDKLGAPLRQAHQADLLCLAVGRPGFDARRATGDTAREAAA